MAISTIPMQGFSQQGINFRNIIINGDMSIAQRGTSSTGITGNGYFSVDRFKHIISGLGTWTASQSTDVPTGQGFSNSFKMDCTTADASPAAGDYNILAQIVEGANVQHLKKGTSSAESITWSFWVKSNKTGTYICEILDGNNTRQISKSYTISSSNTWEKKTITMPGDTSGAIGTGASAFLQFNFWLAVGSDRSSGTLNTSWNSTTNANRAVGQVNLADNTSNEWYITGIQLEAGTTASDFEFLPKDVNLQRCLRYYEKSYNQDTSPADGLHYNNTITTYQGTVYSTGAIRTLVYFKVPKRTPPTATFYYVDGLAGGTTAARWDYWNGSSWVQTNSSTGTGEIEEYAIDINVAHSGLTVGYARLVGGGWSVDAEL
tara:strand:- start:788 stop:1915 length:1128 start_codon:yes stop_codon:yes gene_type:complete